MIPPIALMIFLRLIVMVMIVKLIMEMKIGVAIMTQMTSILGINAVLVNLKIHNIMIIIRITA
jgi:hypothetical protein